MSIYLIILVWLSFALGLLFGCHREIPGYGYDGGSFDFGKVWKGKVIRKWFKSLHYNYQRVLVVIVLVVLIPLVCGPMTLGKWLFKKRK